MPSLKKSNVLWDARHLQQQSLLHFKFHVSLFYSLNSVSFLFGLKLFHLLYVGVLTARVFYDKPDQKNWRVYCTFTLHTVKASAIFPSMFTTSNSDKASCKDNKTISMLNSTRHMLTVLHLQWAFPAVESSLNSWSVPLSVRQSDANRVYLKRTTANNETKTLLTL